LLAEGLATAVTVMFEMLADWASPEDPEFRPTTQLLAAYAAPPAIRAPSTAETTFERRFHLLDFA
jgi:hypothetical protein